LSSRREGNFLALNGAAISPTLMESELFGHEKGAFTSAVDRHVGCFEQADGGTLFLDEITEMALEIQPKFLRVLEENQIRRIGGNKNIPVSVRVIAATNRLPAAAVKEGKLRQDLFYRLNVFHVELPALRERGEDIELLAGFFLETFAKKYNRSTVPWQTDFAPALRAHSWPGNVRELRNDMERLTVLPSGSQLTAHDFQQYCLATPVEEQSDLGPLSLAEAERLAIERALSATSGNKTQAAQLLGITPKTLNAKLALYSKE
jgi:DNA-binding NtrC family response regulator